MTKKIFIYGLILGMLASGSLYGQANKHPAINLSGTIFDEYDHVVGWISSQGVVQNAIDDRIAVIDKDGNAFDGKGQRIGKMENDTFVDPHGSVIFTVSEPKNQQCMLIAPDGKIVGVVHPFYRNQASAIHCLYAKMKVY